MTTLADRTIASLRSTHDDLAASVPGRSDEQLAQGSGASEWTVAQVLSHLGSGAEITLAGVRAAADGAAPPGPDFNQPVWERWDAMSAREQASGFMEHDAALLDTLEALTPEQRERLQLPLGFAPAPLPLASFAGIRLSEAVLHSWDVRVASNPAATLDAEAADVLLEHFSGGLGFLLGFTGKADAMSEPAVVELQQCGLALRIDEQVSLSASAEDGTATFTGAPEAGMRLIAGRLTAPYTPAGVDVTGNVSLDDLRRVFPGY